MVRFFLYSISEAETIEYLKCPALETVSLAIKNLRSSFIHYASVDTAMRHPGRHHKTVTPLKVCRTTLDMCAYPAGPAPTMSLS
jgi:hypothetical protein